MKHFRNVSTVKCGVSENPAKGLCNLPILNKLQSVTVGRRPQLRRDCDENSLPTHEFFFSRRKKTSVKKGLRLSFQHLLQEVAKP